jgi:5-methylcytosine-specific restriction endonuclease McrA
MALTLCACGNTHDKSKACAKCNHGKRTASQKTTKERGYDWNWKSMSERIRKEEPLCADCIEKGKVTPATECHHKVKIKDAPHMRLSRDNVIQLCHECHQERTEKGE